MTEANVPTIGQVVGPAVKHLRQSRGMLQDELSRSLRSFGLEWDRTALSKFEAGRRHDLTLAEIVVLSIVLQVPVAELLPERGRIRLAPGAEITAYGLKAAIRGDLGEVTAGDLDVPWTRRRLALAWGRGETARSVYQQVAEGGDVDLAADVDQLVGDLERNVGRKLDVDPRLVALAAFGYWNRSLTAERDRRVAALTEEGRPKRSLQAVRGHVTRQLVSELAPIIKETQ